MGETPQQPEPASSSGEILAKIAPVIFVFLWSTGFIGAKLGLPYAEPFTFLAIRVLIVVPIMGLLVLLLARSRTTSASEAGHSMVTGILVHCCYLGGVFFAISRGMPAGISALIVSLQPLVTAIFASWILKERLSSRTLFWFLAGIGGVALVLSPRIFSGTGSEGVTPINMSASIVSTVGISLGAVYQKRFVSKSGLLVTTFWQYVGAAIGFGALALLFETREVFWSGEFVFAMTWLVLVLSVGAVLLLMYLVRRDSAQKTASLFYLVPALVAVIAWLMFGETLQPVQFVGMAIIMLAVYMSSRVPKGQ